MIRFSSRSSIHVLERFRQVLVRIDPVALQSHELVDERLVVDRVHEAVVLVTDVRRVAVEHGVPTVVLCEDISPVEVLDDNVPEPPGGLVGAVDLVPVRQHSTRYLRPPVRLGLSTSGINYHPTV